MKMTRNNRINTETGVSLLMNYVQKFENGTLANGIVSDFGNGYYIMSYFNWSYGDWQNIGVGDTFVTQYISGVITSVSASQIDFKIPIDSFGTTDTQNNPLVQDYIPASYKSDAFVFSDSLSDQVIDGVRVIGETIGIKNKSYGYGDMFYQTGYDDIITLSIPADTELYKLQQLFMSDAVAVIGCQDVVPFYNAINDGDDFSMFALSKTSRKLTNIIDPLGNDVYHLFFATSSLNTQHSAYYRMKSPSFYPTSGFLAASFVFKAGKVGYIRPRLTNSTGVPGTIGIRVSDAQVVTDNGTCNWKIEDLGDGFNKVTMVMKNSNVSGGGLNPDLSIVLSTVSDDDNCVGDNYSGVFISGVRFWATDSYDNLEYPYENIRDYNYYKQFDAGSLSPSIRMIALDRDSIVFNKYRNKFEFQGIMLG